MTILPSCRPRPIGCALALVGLTSAIPVAAAPLTFAQAIERATAFAPSLKARETRTRAAQTAADAADALPDPKLDVSLQNLPVTRSEAFSLGDDFMTMKTIGIRQDFPNLAKRHARQARAEADIAATEADQAVEARDVRVAAALAWVDLHYAERRLAILDLLDKSIDAIAGTVAARIASGSARPSQGLKPRQLKAELADRRSDVTAEMAKATAELTRWTGDRDPQAEGPPPDWTIDPDKLIAAIGALPRLQALDAAAAQADADVRLARADKHPDWSVSLSYGKREPNFSDMVSIGISIDLPLFAKHRQDPLIAAKLDDAQAARLERQAAEREVRARLEADLAAHRAHHERWMRATQTLVPLAQKQADLDRASYAAGRIDLGTALDATVALANARIDALDREAMAVRDGIRIDLTYGKDPL
jgi:cobalt-zinc-cadmium efflux system outer membrane protein